jgi:PAS domain-containing protein
LSFQYGRQSDPLRAFVFTLAPKWQRPEILEAVFDQLSDALFLHDKDLGVVGVNQSAQRLFGMSSEAMIGKQCQELFRCTALFGYEKDPFTDGRAQHAGCWRW